ncbi:MAG: GNAT family N-acetyltransferase [Lachnospiraceae bacterium]|nr:GNAT family N-acetyltransferase [Lachnospiraceae bacterium]
MIRQATKNDVSRIAEILVFSKRMNYREIFQNDAYSFGELQVDAVAKQYDDEEILSHTWVYTETLTDRYLGTEAEIVKGVVEVVDSEIRTLYVDSFFVGEGIGGELVEYAKRTLDGRFLWVLERNERAIRFYMRHGFLLSGERIPEPDTEEYLVRLECHEDKYDT